MSHLESNSATTVKRTLRRKIEIPAFSEAEELASNRYQVYRGLSPDTSNRLEKKIMNLEENLESEKQSKISVEQEIQMLVEELQLQNDLNEELIRKLNEQTSTTRSKDQEFFRLRKEYELLVEEHEGNEATMKKKFQDVVTDLSEQLDIMNKQRSKVESEKRRMMMELNETSSHLESANALKRQLDSKIETLENESRRLKGESDDKSRQFHEVQESKAKLTHDYADLVTKLTSLESSCDGFSRDRLKLVQEIESLKIALEEAESIKPLLVSSINGLQADLQTLKDDLEDEVQNKQLLQSQILKFQSDLNAQKIKFDKDLALQLQESETHRKKLSSQVSEADDQLSLHAKRGAKLEKDNSRLNTDIKELYEELALHKAQISEFLKKMKGQENNNNDQRNQIDQLNMAIESKTESEDRLHGEVSKLKVVLKSVTEDLDKMTRENKLAKDALKEAKEETKDARRQLEGMAMMRNNSDKEILRLTGKLGETERHMGDRDNEVHVLSNEVKVVKEDMKSVLKLKEEEIIRLKHVQEKMAEEGLRRIDEEQARHKNEVNRVRKGFENEFLTIQSSHDVLSRQHAEANKNSKNHNNRIKELESMVVGLEGMVEDVRSQLGTVERRRGVLELQLDQVQNKLDTTEVIRRNLDLSFQDAMQQNEHLSGQLSGSHSEHKRAESELLTLKFLTDEFANTKKDLEEILEKQKHEIERLNEAINLEMERSTEAERVVGEMERKLRESRMYLEELEGRILKEERKMNAKMAARCHGMEAELEGEQKKLKDMSTENRKLSKHVQELAFERDTEMGEREEREREIQSAGMLIAKLKKGLLESEDVISLVTSKYKRLQHQFNETMADKEQLESAVSHTSHTGPTSHTSHSHRGSSHINVTLPSSTRLSIARSMRFGE